LVAEPIQEQHEEVVDQAPEDVANPTDLEGKPLSITYYFKL
jgi:hypothetical protein